MKEKNEMVRNKEFLVMSKMTENRQEIEKRKVTIDIVNTDLR